MARFAFMRVGGNEWDYFLAGKINFLECLLVATLRWRQDPRKYAVISQTVFPLDFLSLANRQPASYETGRYETY